MPDLQTTVAREDAEIDGMILSMLVHDDSHRPWSIEEVAREIGSPADATDGLGRLDRAGLTRRLEGYVFASRAALRAEEIAQ